jgi:RNA polymerase subunit RPABC4/transcription elongation factor Spt4
MATCKKCGTEIEAGEKFCPSCGTPVTSAPAKTAVAEKPKGGMDAKAMNTKIGVSAGLVAAAAYFLGMVGGWVPVVLIAGYVLVAESNEWLRMSVIKAVGVCVFFAIISTLVGLIPNMITIINNLASIFRGSFSIAVVSRIVTAFNSIWSFLERLLLLLLGFRALQQDTISFGPIDGLIAKHTLKKSG